MGYLTLSLLPFLALNVSVALLSMQGQKALGFYQKYLNSCYEDKRRSYMFRTTWARVINDRIFIFAELFLLVVAKNICVFMSFQMSFFFSWMWEAFASLTVWFQVFPHALTFKCYAQLIEALFVGWSLSFFHFFFFKHFISNNWKNGHFNVPKVWNDSSICVVKTISLRVKRQTKIIFNVTIHSSPINFCHSVSTFYL